MDAELEQALGELDPPPRSRSHGIRDLALLGAEARRERGRRHQDALAHLGRIARGETSYDPASARGAHEERERGYG